MFKSRIPQVTQEITDKLITTMREKQKEIADAAMDQTPLDDGELRDNQLCTEEITKNRATFIISYGSDAVSAEYAVIQHENPYYHHPVGNDKFLERPFHAIAPTVRDALEKALS